MRVLHVFKVFRPDFTGEGIFTERLTSTLNEMYPDVRHDVLATNTPRPKTKADVVGGFENLYYLNGGLTRDKTFSWKMLFWFVVHALRYDTIHFHTHVDRSCVTYLVLHLFGRRTVLSSTLDDSISGILSTYRASIRAFVRKIFADFRAYIAISPKLYEETLDLVEASRVNLIPIGISIPDGIDSDRRAENRASHGLAEDDVALLFVGGICVRKDPLFIVQNLSKLIEIEPKLKLMIVGPILEPDYHAELLRTLQQDGLDDRVLFIGEVSNPYPFYEMSDMMTFTSKLEGFGTVVIEAMAHGLPVVVRHLPGVNDYFVHQGINGFYFDDDRRFAEYVGALLRDRDLRRRIGDAARQSIMKSFSMAEIGRLYMDVYRSANRQPFVLSEGQDEEAHGQARISHAVAAAPANQPTLADNVRPVMQPLRSSANWQPATLPKSEQPLLLTFIDAEEAFDWDGPFSREHTDVKAMSHIHDIHQTFEKYGVIPTYLVDYPVASQEAGYSPLREYVADGKCEIGAQLHPWVNPPYIEEPSIRNSYFCNLNPTLQREKLEALSEAITRNMGIEPRIFRAGRYGVGSNIAELLEELNYEIDCSVMPQRDFSAEFGPNFFGFDSVPYWFGSKNALLEIPTTSHMVGVAADRLRGLVPLIYSETAESLHLPAVLARLKLMERIRLTPEGITLLEAQRLVQHMLGHGYQIFSLSFHSPSLVPGNTPYVTNQTEAEQFKAWLDSFYDFFINEIGGKCVTCAWTYETLHGLKPRAAAE